MMSRIPPDLSVVIVTWNVRDLALHALSRVMERSEGISVELIVVDNASADGTIEAVRGAFPEAVLVANAENMGFPRGCNQGIDLARGRHVLLLNPDAEPGETGTLAALVAALDRDQALGAVGPRLEYPDGRLQPECARRDYRIRHLIWEAFYLHTLFPRNSLFAHQVMGEWNRRGTREVEALSGAFLMLRREAVVMVGGLPEDLFMYHEDLSLCLRLRRGGWGIACLGEELGIHIGGASSRQQLRPIDLLAGEVRVRLIRERMGPIMGWVARWVFAFASLVRLFLAVILSVVPGLRSVRARHPRAFALRVHWMLLLWALLPAKVVPLLPPPPPPSRAKIRVLFVGPTESLRDGSSGWMSRMLRSVALRRELEIYHLETADRRVTPRPGRLTVVNILRALRHVAELRTLCRERRPELVVISISRSVLGFVANSLFVRIACARGIPVVLQIPESGIDDISRGAGWFSQWLIRGTMRPVTAGWVLSEAGLPVLRKWLPDGSIRIVQEVSDGPRREAPSGREASILLDAVQEAISDGSSRQGGG